MFRHRLGDYAGSDQQELTKVEMPIHNHGVNDPGHNHAYGQSNNVNTGSNLNLPGDDWYWLHTKYVSTSRTGISIRNSGGGWAHNNQPPYFVVVFIMKQYV